METTTAFLARIRGLAALVGLAAVSVMRLPSAGKRAGSSERPAADSEPRTNGSPRPRPEQNSQQVAPAEDPPPETLLPGLSPPPGKEERLRSGLPPGKEESLRSGLPPEKQARSQLRSPGPEAAAAPPPAPPPGPGRGAPPPPVAEAPSASWEACTVVWWRRYVTSAFYALAARPDGTTYVAARSPGFRWRRRESPPPSAPAAAAHARLVERLAEDGWEATDAGFVWYRTTLRRPVDPTPSELAAWAQPRERPTATVALIVAAIAGAEACVAFAHPVLGALVHAVLLAALLSLAGASDPERADTAGRWSYAFAALALVPLARLLSLVLAIREIPELYRYGVVGLPLLVAVTLAMRLPGSSLVRSRLRSWSRSQVWVAAGGVPLGLAGYVLLRPDGLLSGQPPVEVVIGLAIVFLAGSLEEVIFRGFVQGALTEIVGRAGVLAGSVLFAATYLGGGSSAYLGFIAAVGLTFGLLVDRTRSLVGVCVAHGLLNAGALLVWPALLG